MKNRANIFIVIIAALLAASCSKETPNAACFKVKRIGAMCSNIVFQIQDPNYYYLAQNNWYDGISGNTYDHVFTQKNPCETIIVNAANEATVQINAEQPTFACLFSCNSAYPSPMPTKEWNIKLCANN